MVWRLYLSRNASRVAARRRNVKTWIERMNDIAAGMVFQGGYVAAPPQRVFGHPTRVGSDARHEAMTSAAASGSVQVEHWPGRDARRLCSKLAPN
jgi:hypothetical protein